MNPNIQKILMGRKFSNASAPSVFAPPAQTGNFFVGQTLTRVAGVYFGSPTPTVTWVWQKNGVDISGTANAATYVIQAGDDGATITVKDTATNSSGSVNSSSTGVIAIQLALWLDAADISTISQVGGSVSAWADKSGNGYNATQGTATNQPVTGTRAINSLNALDFDGTNDQLTLPSGLYNNLGSSPQTTFVLYQSDNAGGSTQRLLTGQVSGFLRYGNYISLTLFRAINRSSLLPTDISATRNTAVHIGGHVRNGASLIPHYDGVAGSNANNSEDISLTSMSIGDGVTPGTSPFDGLIGEAIVCKRALSNAEINQIGLYLASKWGGTWTGL